MKKNICKFCGKQIKDMGCPYCGCLTPIRKTLNKDSDINSEFTDYCYNRYDQGVLQKGYSYWLKFNIYLFTGNSPLNRGLNFLFNPLIGGKPNISFKNEKLIDVGCGRGDFIKLLPKKWKTYGCEIVNYRDTPKNIAIGNFEKMQFKDKYTIVRSSHSLEHSLNPKKFLGKMVNITEKNGVLIILSPNSESLSYKLFKAKWAALNIDSHFCILNIKAVSEYLTKNNCKIIYSNTYTMFQTVGSVMELLKIKNNSFIFFMTLVILYTPMMLLEAIFGKADSFIIYAKKL